MLIHQEQKSLSNIIPSWKIRSINGFEKYLFPNIPSSTKSIPKYKLSKSLDPARFIYPRDAMGNMLNRNNHIVTPYYFPNYDYIQARSPAWTITKTRRLIDVARNK